MSFPDFVTFCDYSTNQPYGYMWRRFEENLGDARKFLNPQE